MPAMAIPEPHRWSRALPGQEELPCSDGEPMETYFHVAQMSLLMDSLWTAWSNRRDFFVGGNMFVYFSEHQVRSNDFRGPDVFVVLDTESKPRKSWVAWEEGGKLPNVVIEITSPTTEHVDRGEKMRIYSGIWRTPGYFILDPESLRVDGYRLDVDRLEYVPISPNHRGDLAVPQLGLFLGMRPTRYRDFDQPFLRWLDPKGNPLPTAQERAADLEQRAASFEQRAADFEQRATDFEQRATASDEQAAAALERVRELEARLASVERNKD